jgi:hypothetical protein
MVFGFRQKNPYFFRHQAQALWNLNQLTADIYWFIQPGTAQAKACGYILPKPQAVAFQQKMENRKPY